MRCACGERGCNAVFVRQILRETEPSLGILDGLPHRSDEARRDLDGRGVDMRDFLPRLFAPVSAKTDAKRVRSGNIVVRYRGFPSRGCVLIIGAGRALKPVPVGGGERERRTVNDEDLRWERSPIA